MRSNKAQALELKLLKESVSGDIVPTYKLQRKSSRGNSELKVWVAGRKGDTVMR